jgi:hypothetical protein
MVFNMPHLKNNAIKKSIKYGRKKAAAQECNKKGHNALIYLETYIDS